METDDEARWLLLLHQIPAKPAYARVKVWRRLAEIGAVPIKNAVHVLPNTAQAREDFEWLLREVEAAGGDAAICEASLLDGLADDDVRALFNAARDQDYERLAAEIREALNRLDIPRQLSADDRSEAAGRLKRWRRQLTELAAIDFFGAPGRTAAEKLMADVEVNLNRSETAATPSQSFARDELRGRTWVTRQGIKVDRIACAWLIRRFIDPGARFKFVPGKGYAPGAGELRFDMFEAEFTHEGDRCSFEVVLARAGLADAALHKIAEIVHDIDLKDAKFKREEAFGVDRLIAGLCMGSPDDEGRLSKGGVLFDSLYEYFHRKRA